MVIPQKSAILSMTAPIGVVLPGYRPSDYKRACGKKFLAAAAHIMLAQS
jgi:hypothetical protein